MNSRRGASAISEPIELLIIDKSALDPIPTPPHPSALMFSNTHKPTRTKVPFSRNYLTMEERAVCVLLNKIIRPLEDLAVVSDTVTPGRNVWRCWVRVPGKRESWESKKERVEGIKSMDGIFHRVNITCVYPPNPLSGCNYRFLVVQIHSRAITRFCIARPHRRQRLLP